MGNSEITMKKEINDIKIFPSNERKEQEVSNSTENSFFMKEGVKGSKNNTIKILCESAAESTGLSKEQFYIKSNITRHQWYYWAWGIYPFPNYIKIKLCDLFGKTFRDLFMKLPEVKNG